VVIKVQEVPFLFAVHQNQSRAA